MNLWHQRVIIFFAKVLAVILGLIFIGYFLYYNIYFKTDALIKYVPKEAVAYATFRLTPELDQNQIIQKIKSQLEANDKIDVNFNSFNQLSGNNLSLALVPQGDKLGTLILIDLGARNNLAQEYLKISQEHNWPAQIFSNKIKTKIILALADSEALLNQVNQVAGKKQPALSQKADVVLNLKKFDPKNFAGKFYLAADFFKYQIPQGQRPPFGAGSDQFQFISALLPKSGQGQFFAGITAQQNSIIIQNNETLKQDLSGSKPNWPANISYSLTLSNLAKTLPSMLETLKQNDSDLYANLGQKQAEWEGLYDFDWETDILPMLGNQAQVIATNDKQFLAAVTLENESPDGQVAKIEKIIKTYIATKYPIEKQRQLPDGTWITAITRDTKPFNFSEQDDNILGLKIKVLNYNNQEFIYALSGNHLILANSRELLYNFLGASQKVKDWQTTGLIYNYANSSENLYINLASLGLNKGIGNYLNTLSIYEDNSGGVIRLILE